MPIILLIGILGLIYLASQGPTSLREFRRTDGQLFRVGTLVRVSGKGLCEVVGITKHRSLIGKSRVEATIVVEMHDGSLALKNLGIGELSPEADATYR